MNYIIYAKDFVIYQIGDRTGTADHKAIRSFFLGAKQPVAVAVIRVTPRIFEIEDDKSNIESVAASVYSGDYMMQHEKLSDNKYQVFGIEKNLIDAIHQQFEPEEVELITPYALALRRYIDSLRIDVTNRYILFIEYIKERNTVLLSFFYNNRHLSTRAVKYNLNTLRSEIVRDIQSYSSGTRAISFICFTNSEEVGNYLSEKEIFKRDEINITKDQYPSIKGLEAGYDEFPHFMSEGKLLEQERAARQKRELVFLSASAGVFIICLISWLFFTFRLNNKQYQLAALETELKDIKSNIIKTNQGKYITYYTTNREKDLSSELARFYRALPPGSILDSFSISHQKGEGYSLIAFLIKADITSRGEELKKALGIFPDSIVENIVIRDMLGYKVIIKLGNKTDNIKI